MYRDDLESARAAIRTLQTEVEAQRKQAEAAIAAKLAAEAARDEVKLALSYAGGQERPVAKSRTLLPGILVALLVLMAAAYAWYGAHRNSQTEARHRAAGAALESRIAKLRSEIRSLRTRRATTKSVVGALSREVIRSVVSTHMNSVKACYESALPTHPGLAGKLVTEWVIGPMGTVQTARQISSTLKSAPVEVCVLSQIRTWRFPPTGEEKSVRYPFIFVQSSGGDVGKVGYLIANTQPWAKVFIDGKDTGKTTPITPKDKIALAPGLHTVTFVANKGKRNAFRITIKSGVTTRLIKRLPN